MVNIERLRDFFVDVFPAMNLEQKRLALALYRGLATGIPVAVSQLAESVDLSRAEIERILHEWPGVFFDEDNRVVGFWGIALAEMPHRMRINGQTVYAWCAWDTLFIPQLLDRTVRVDSACPVTGDAIRLVVSPDRVEPIGRRDVSVSFLTPDPAKIREDVTTSFCHYVFFFASPAAAGEWIGAHPGTFLLNLESAFSLGAAVNRARYGRNFQWGQCQSKAAPRGIGHGQA